jgi:hypothetical protein
MRLGAMKNLGPVLALDGMVLVYGVYYLCSCGAVGVGGRFRLVGLSKKFEKRKAKLTDSIL